MKIMRKIFIRGVVDDQISYACRISIKRKCKIVVGKSKNFMNVTQQNLRKEIVRKIDYEAYIYIRFICVKALVHSPLLSQISEARKLYTIKILTKYINMKIYFNKTIPTCKILHIIKTFCYN